eukprot:128040-Rhodomonas_salina.4
MSSTSLYGEWGPRSSPRRISAVVNTSPGSSIADVSTARRIAHAQEHSLFQSRTSHSAGVAR